MKLSHATAVAVLGIAGTLAACDAGGTLQAPNAEVPLDVEQMESDAASAAAPNSDPALGQRESDIPEPIRSFLKPGDTLLAYKKMPLPDNAGNGAVIIIRHPIPKGPFSFSRNPCELLVLRQNSNSYAISGRSTKAVDCTNIAFSKEMAARPDDLNEYLEVRDGEITYTNQYTKNTSVYSFEYSESIGAWFLSSAINNYTRDGASNEYLENITEVARYPQNIGWISMQDFNPEDLQEIFKKNRIVD